MRRGRPVQACQLTAPSSLKKPGSPNLERMALRQLRYEDARQHGHDGMLAISVKRQKKLKMKKKKYKKLMRRTRNLRRKLTGHKVVRYKGPHAWCT